MFKYYQLYIYNVHRINQIKVLDRSDSHSPFSIKWHSKWERKFPSLSVGTLSRYTFPPLVERRNGVPMVGVIQ